MKANKARTILLVIGGLDDDDDNVKEGEKIVQGCTQSHTYVRTSIYYKCGGICSKTIRNIHIHTYQSNEIMVVIDDKKKKKGLSHSNFVKISKMAAHFVSLLKICCCYSSIT